MTTFYNRYVMIAALLAVLSTVSASPLNPGEDPVELAEFSVSGGDHAFTLTWRTTSETDNAGFEIFRTNGDGDTTWTKAIGNNLTSESLVGLGTSTVGRTYTFLDNDPSLEGGGTYCYRLVSISTSGDRVTHPFQCGVLQTASTNKPNSPAEPVNVIPNPTRGRLWVSYALPAASTVSFQIFATDGSLVLSPLKSEPRGAGKHTDVIAVDELLTGTYMLRIVTDDTSFDERFVVR